MQPTNVHSMGDVVESRTPSLLSDGTLSKIPDNELYALERHLLGLLQSIRRIRGLPPMEAAKHRREV